MWKVKITSTKEDLLKSLDSIEISVVFTDGNTEIPKTYKLWVDEVTTVDSANIIKQIIVDRDRLNKMEEVKSVLLDQLNKEL
jgi:hypothetical protein